jgi:hypothetical protein
MVIKKPGPSGHGFLKTIIPSRKATRDYLGGEKNEEDQT